LFLIAGGEITNAYILLEFRSTQNAVLKCLYGKTKGIIHTKIVYSSLCSSKCLT